MRALEAMSKIADVKIRRPRLRDLLALRSMLNVSWGAAYGRMEGISADIQTARFSWLETLIAIQLRDETAGHGTRLVAIADNRIAGFVQSSQHPKGQINLWMLYIDPAFQGRGIGSLLLAAAVESYTDANRIRLEVLQPNTKAIEWYRQRGFEIYNSATKSISGRSGAVYHMEKKL